MYVIFSIFPHFKIFINAEISIVDIRIRIERHADRAETLWREGVIKAWKSADCMQQLLMSYCLKKYRGMFIRFCSNTLSL